MLVFRIKFIISPEIARNVDARNDLLDRWLKEAVEPNGLQFGGGGRGQEWGGVVENAVDLDVEESHRQVIEAWLKANKQVASYEVGPLVDDTVV